LLSFSDKLLGFAILTTIGDNSAGAVIQSNQVLSLAIPLGEDQQHLFQLTENETHQESNVIQFLQSGH